MTNRWLVTTVDLAGTFVLAIHGASVAAAAGLDLLGIVIIAIVSAMGGGIIRDLLVGETPPEALRHWPLITVALAGALLTILFVQQVRTIPEGPLIAIDALGLSLLAVAAAEKSLDYRLTPIAAIMMAAIGGCGGGAMRDVLLMQIPAILRADFLATAAIAGAAVLVVSRRSGLRPVWAAWAGGTTCCLLRLVAVLQGWHLPHL
ncbi:trimeric intracellular cation channel family protein [Sphingomonas sp. AP4-R1]|uniref:trimeric intracellular cation channel family protein n=1 Tax=Sphingomonas sp. AP4-R1 TaxID=2735134 RepID=UPI0014938C67|nr:TRIC cation channel family protein [Sphingomonas sp. AP4-R1]QJU56713.1 trimeric intracellular cation channel family protein [Sphingomonas sp. AP4-R1]